MNGQPTADNTTWLVELARRMNYHAVPALKSRLERTRRGAPIDQPMKLPKRDPDRRIIWPTANITCRRAGPQDIAKKAFGGILSMPRD